MKENNYTSPPIWMLRFFRWFCHPAFVEDIEGDLHERYALLIEEMGLRKARFRFVIEVLLLFRPGLIKSLSIFPELIHPGMLKHNLLITYRGFLKHKMTFFINLVGLSTGLAGVLLIYLWVHDERSVDRFHEKDSQLYQVMINHEDERGIQTWDSSPLPLTKALIEEFPEVESGTFINNSFLPEGKITQGENAIEASRIFANEQFFDVFSYDLIQGDKDQVLAGKDNMVISEELALKLFDSTHDIIGKTIEWSHPYYEKFNGEFQVSGVFETPPANATEQFDAVVHYGLMVENDPPSTRWTSTPVKNYLVLQEGTNIERFNDKFADFLSAKHEAWETSTQFVQQYSKRYLYGTYENGVQAGGRIEYVKLFSIIALFILLIACINFMNLSTAQASRKMKEIGVKKTMGATKSALVLQFLSESMLMVTLSFIVAASLISLILPQFNLITDKELKWGLALSPFLAIAGILLLTGLVAGSYPAFYLSRFKPVAVLKGERSTSSGEYWVRRGLVVFQFAISVVFIVGMLVLDQQMQYTQTKNIGYNRDNVISFQRPRHNDDLEVFLSELRNLLGVTNASNMEGNILSGWSDDNGFYLKGQESDNKWGFMSPQIGYDMIETLGMQIMEGRSFSRTHKDDRSKIIISRSAQKMMQLADPIGQVITNGLTDYEIIGVVEDFHYGSLHKEKKPLFFRFHIWSLNTMVKIAPGVEQATIAKVEELYKEFHPETAFTFTFLDEDNQRLYEAESRVATLSKYFGFLAIIISCLGLFGLVAFTAERRSKEIGIRKILGSSVWGVIKLLSTDFTRMVIMAILLALPISYLITKRWLDNFAYKIELEWWLFGGAALVTLLIAWSVVGLQTLKTARLNPVECLRDE